MMEEEDRYAADTRGREKKNPPWVDISQQPTAQLLHTHVPENFERFSGFSSTPSFVLLGVKIDQEACNHVHPSALSHLPPGGLN